MSAVSGQKKTPLMRQYYQIKAKYPDTVMLFRLGDFYETFETDAEITAKVCGITLTKRSSGSESETPLAGFPYHQLDNYLPKFIKAGYRVAVCEQLEDPKLARGIVRRDVVEVITPGVAMSDKILESSKNNYLASVYIEKNFAGVAFCDVSTGEFATAETSLNGLQEVLESISPSEIIIARNQKDDLKKIKISSEPIFTKLEEWIFDTEYANDRLKEHFGTHSLKGFGIDNMRLAGIAAGGAMHYLLETQKSKLGHLKKISLYQHGDFIALDPATKRNLEILFSTNDGSKTGTLLSVIDRTATPMGGRLLKRWLVHPLRSVEQINKRLSAVEDILNSPQVSSELASVLKGVSDLERLAAKCATMRATPRDLGFIRNTLATLPRIVALLNSVSSTQLNALAQAVDLLEGLSERLNAALPPEPSTTVGEGNAIRVGFSKELDEIREIIAGGKLHIEKIQERERLRTHISSLKIGFNNVFGYYIEITNANKDRVPSDYIRKQTLSNAERYITPELKEFEEKALNAEEKIAFIERTLFNDLVNFVNTFIEPVARNSGLLATIDCFVSFARLALEKNFIKPFVDDSEILEIIDGRHPVVEALLKHGDQFIPNNTYLDTDKSQIGIITGPNMAGKSSYLRQVGLIVLLAQIGCFVPATKAHIGAVDKIFTRVGAQDNITAGESTFLVEMNEAANIMNNATSRSLILLDEVGRGTSTFDGISIAWSMTEFIHENLGSRTLFATHYHELNELAERFERIKNYKIEVRELGDKIIFLRKVTPGTADHSYGIQVAQMAGLPDKITNRAKEILKQLEGENQTGSGTAQDISKQDENLGKDLARRQNPNNNSETDDLKQGNNFSKSTNSQISNIRKANGKAISHSPMQFSLFEIAAPPDPKIAEIKQAINEIDIHSLTPLQALIELEKLKKILA